MDKEKIITKIVEGIEEELRKNRHITLTGIFGEQYGTTLDFHVNDDYSVDAYRELSNSWTQCNINHKHNEIFCFPIYSLKAEKIYAEGWTEITKGKNKGKVFHAENPDEIMDKDEAAFLEMEEVIENIREDIEREVRETVEKQLEIEEMEKEEN